MKVLTFSYKPRITEKLDEINKILTLSRVLTDDLNLEFEAAAVKIRRSGFLCAQLGWYLG